MYQLQLIFITTVAAETQQCVSFELLTYMHRFQQRNIHSIAFPVLLRYTCTWQRYETRLGLYVARQLFPVLKKSEVSR